jgi:folate-binding protein YgfZ
MPPLTAPAVELAALTEGRAAVDLRAHRTVRVTGADARRWLHDLVTTDVASLRPGEARRSLLLDPTGHIRADLQVACDDDGFWLFQASDARTDIAAALAPYVLSSVVDLEDRTGRVRLMALPGPDAAAGSFTPSSIGPGADVLLDDIGSLLPPGRTLVGPEAAEVWRIRTGRARMGVDFDETSIPAEASLEATIDTTKGCFLGQESVARVRNLGHPPRVLLHLRTEAPVDTGSPIVTTDEGADAGTVTSVAADDGSGSIVLASIRWHVRSGPLGTSDGVRFVTVGSPD